MNESKHFLHTTAKLEPNCQVIKLKKDDLIFREAPIDLEIGQIKGCILINKNGSILDINFNPTILAVNVRLEEADKEDVKLVLKKKIILKIKKF